jgi:hypothetical protein
MSPIIDIKEVRTPINFDSIHPLAPKDKNIKVTPVLNACVEYQCKFKSALEAICSLPARVIVSTLIKDQISDAFTKHTALTKAEMAVTLPAIPRLFSFDRPAPNPIKTAAVVKENPPNNVLAVTSCWKALE